MSPSKTLAAPAALILAATPALAEVCDKIAPYWTPSDFSVPAPAAIVVAAITGVAAGALAGAVRPVWLALCILLPALAFWLGDNDMARLARAEGCEPGQLKNAAMLLVAAGIPALILFLILKRPCQTIR